MENSIIIESILPNVWKIMAPQNSVNALVWRQNNEVLVVDSLLRAQDSRQLAAFIHEELQCSVRYMLNTHWHSDHVYGNRFLVDETTDVVAHQKHLETIRRERTLLGKHHFQRDERLMPPPTIVIDHNYHFAWGDLNVEILLAPGHTEDSLLIYFPETQVLVAGDTVLSAPNQGKWALPYFVWGDAQALRNTLMIIEKRQPQLIIPGHGMIPSLATIVWQREYIEQLLVCVQSHHEQYVSLDWEEATKHIVAECPIEQICRKSSEQIWVKKVHRQNIQKVVAQLRGINYP